VHPCTGTEALYRLYGPKGEERYSSTLYWPTALEGDEGSASRPGRSLPPGKDLIPIVQEAGWAPGQVWTGAENLAPTGIRSPDRPARSQSLYWLSYPAHIIWIYVHINIETDTLHNCWMLLLQLWAPPVTAVSSPSNCYELPQLLHTQMFGDAMQSQI